MTSEEQLRARLCKIEALFAGAATPGVKSRTCSPSPPQFGTSCSWPGGHASSSCSPSGSNVQEAALEVRIRADGLASLVGELRQSGARKAA
jgi:hypothetical protein